MVGQRTPPNGQCRRSTGIPGQYLHAGDQARPGPPSMTWQFRGRLAKDDQDVGNNGVFTANDTWRM
jgi:hypothetical protein